MTDDEIEELLPRLDFIIDYCTSIKEYALKKAIEGKKWKGYVLSETSTKRKISDEEAVKKILKDAGFNPEVTKLMSISDLQKMVGKTKFNDLVGDYIIKPKGQPVLAPESDAKNNNTEDKTIMLKIETGLETRALKVVIYGAEGIGKKYLRITIS